MAKTSKPIPQKEAASSSRLTGGEDVEEPRPEEFIPVGCSTVGLGKDVVMRPSSGDKEVPALKQVKERKRKDLPSSPSLEKKKPAKRSRKPKGGSVVVPSEVVRQLRDESEKGEENLACVRANVVIQQSFDLAEANQGILSIIPEQKEAEIIPSRAKMTEGDTEGGTSRAVEDFSRDEFRIVDISGSPQISDAMIREASMLEDRSYEGIQKSADIHDFLEGLESGASKEVTGFGGMPASVLHHEAFLRIREEHDAEVRSLTKKSDSYKLLSEKLRADLTAAREEHEEMAEQVRQRITRIGRLNSQVDGLRAEVEEFKKNKAGLANELEVARSEVIEANKRTDAKVAQFRIDVEVNQDKAKSMVEHAKWQAQREALEEVSAQSSTLGPRLKSPGRRRTKLEGWPFLRRTLMTRGSGQLYGHGSFDHLELTVIPVEILLP
ncbi:uncharacterized protein [Nicotiana tomentosiformis]|uniref:uncharacterized protein n=1 Tax=Nicotiana tomentosiformis TaxID=4098 RepID=UPI00388C64A6